MAKEKNPCNSQNVSDETVAEQVAQLENMLTQCKDKGGSSLRVRVVYGCTNDKQLGNSAPIPWPPAPYDDLDRPLTEEEQLYLATKIRELMEDAEKSAAMRCPKGSDTIFRVQGFCKNSKGDRLERKTPDGRVIEEYTTPFSPTKTTNNIQP